MRSVRLADLIAVMAGAGIGGGLRFTLGMWIAQNTKGVFPWHTFAINVIGSFLLGLLMGIAAERSMLTSTLVLFLGVGLLGGFTTFSTFSYESLTLLERGMLAQGVGYMTGSLLLGLVGATIGLAMGRAA